MSEKPTRNVQVSASVPTDQAEKLEELFFDGRGTYKRKNDVLRHAISYFLENIEETQKTTETKKTKKGDSTKEAKK